MNANLPRIVCATDFSPKAARAADVAALLAARLRGRLDLVHAAQITGADLLIPAHRRLRNEAVRLRQTGITVDPVLLRGFPAGDAVLKHLRRELPALVVMSAAVKGAIDRWAFGSVSEQVAQASPVPSLVIRDAEPFERWGGKGPALKVLVALDLYATSDGVLRWVKRLLRAGPCDITACHVNWMSKEQLAAIPGAEPLTLSNRPRVQARLERDLKKKIRDVLGDDSEVHVLVRPTCGEVESTVIEIAHELKADLVVVGTHQRHALSRLFHGSLSRAVLHDSAANVACVPITAQFDPTDAHIPDYRRVLVATDFSELGNAAVPFACGACAIGGLLEIVHVAPPTRSGSGAAQAKLQDLRAKLRGLVPAELGARGQSPEIEVIEHAEPAVAICREADRFGADLVCLASHGLSGSKAVFGSVTQQVLKQIRRPFLVVRRPDE